MPNRKQSQHAAALPFPPSAVANSSSVNESAESDCEDEEDDEEEGEEYCFEVVHSVVADSAFDSKSAVVVATVKVRKFDG